MTTKMRALVHTVAGLERWDTLAWRYYGNPFAYGRLIEANPALDIGITLPEGARVLVPLLTTDEVQVQRDAAQVPPWKR